MDLSLFVSILAWFVAAFVSGLCGIGAAAIATAIVCRPCHEPQILSLLSLEDCHAHVWGHHPRFPFGPVHPAVRSCPYPGNLRGHHAHLLHCGHGSFQKRQSLAGKHGSKHCRGHDRRHAWYLREHRWTRCRHLRSAGWLAAANLPWDHQHLLPFAHSGYLHHAGFGWPLYD